MKIELSNKIFDGIGNRLAKNDGLFNGNLGTVLLCFIHYKIYGEERYLDKGVNSLSKVLKRIDKGQTTLNNPTVSEGLTGLGMLLDFIKKNDLVNGLIDFDFIDDIDEFAREGYSGFISLDNYGYSTGAAGCLYYLLQRGESLNKNDLNSYISNLISVADFDSEGARFPPGNLHSSFNTKEFINHYNLGLSDGLTGILIVLLKAYPLMAFPEKLKSFIEDGIAFILNQERIVDYNNERYCFFPTAVSNLKSIRKEKKEFYNSRLGWCMGDLSIAFLLCYAGERLHNSYYKEKGLEVAEFTCKRISFKETKIDDNYICHGNSGLAILYDSLYQLTNSSILRQTSNYWYNKSNVIHENFVKGKTGLLTGYAGWALSQIDMEYPNMFKWREFLLI